MSKIRNWYVKHQDAITWFVIGSLLVAAVNSAIHGTWIWAGVCAVLAAINYKFRKFRMR
jgi:hypothetical protein